MRASTLTPPTARLAGPLLLLCVLTACSDRATPVPRPRGVRVVTRCGIGRPPRPAPL